MKINNKILSIPPYISTSWNNIRALHMKGTLLMVTLVNGESITIPGLDQSNIELIFNSHTAYLEQKAEITTEKNLGALLQGMNSGEQIDSPFRIAFSATDGLGSMLMHNPAQANAPELPKEILQKIRAIVQILSADENMSAPKPEPHCNCPHCQIARAIHQSIDKDESMSLAIEEEVKPEDISFQQWEIKQSGDKLYTVTNKLDTHEIYNVFLGEPVGCTCGKSGCEHLVAVLKS